ncbi:MULTISPECIES: sugar kinase [Mesorhizobium]|uniref:2-dehydro-3-deoxygluconokinase n=1 Tax=Mesorhizobium shonense TaxID=1209948 RepID=A0ABV2HW78_9HYPH|nr:sugar kinase [Mesorhizobium sp.]RWB21670.1 MAG: sugar kinase [Mesorhizobium sp.]RWE00881.1 MAG: sugar kinase [Mesorhizobium sp.]TIS51871.1 MAG: sugar kinase [Mesorhizobium sp.]
MTANGIASIGECMLELSGQAGPNWRMGFAGDTFNTLWALHALSPERPATYVSAFGDDPFSRDQIGFFAQNGIGIGNSPVIAGARPGLYAITLTGAERAFTYWRSDAAARQLASDPVALEKSLENQALVYFSGITLAILDNAARKILLAAIATARSTGSLVAFDPNYRPRLWQSRETAQAAILEALAVADIALPTFPDEQMLFADETPQATAERLGKLVGEVVVKNGEQPALIAMNGEAQTVEAVHVATPVDTTGAGDSFNGGYLAARLAGHAPADAARRAHKVAAAVVQVRGALAPFETLRAAFDS